MSCTVRNVKIKRQIISFVYQLSEKVRIWYKSKVYLFVAISKKFTTKSCSKMENYVLIYNG